MNKRLKQNIYIFIIMILALSLFIITFNTDADLYSMIFSLDIDNPINIYSVLFWTLLAIIAETFLIISPSSGVATSVAPAIYIYIMIVSNPFIVMIVALIGSILRFPEYDGERKHIFNTKKSTTFFNAANLTLTFGICAWIVNLRNSFGDNNYIVIGLLSVIGLLVAEFVNFILVSILIRITQGVQAIHIFRSMIKTFPSTIAIGMLGIFLVFVHNEYEMIIILIFFIPLLLARYSFKLYFESQRMALDTIHALNEALHAKDAYTGGHTGRVEQYSVNLAKAYGLSYSDVEIIRTAALLHDIGKIGIPDEILNKPGRLTRSEFELIQEHSTIGAKILGNVNSLKKVSNIIVQHHERYDGSGYPNGLKENEISIEAAILMISDSYDAMTTDRPYRNALTKTKAISELEKCSGTQFNPVLARVFIDGVLSKEESHNEKLNKEEFSDKNILIKTKEIVEANSDLPQDIMKVGTKI